MAIVFSRWFVYGGTPIAMAGGVCLLLVAAASFLLDRQINIDKGGRCDGRVHRRLVDLDGMRLGPHGGSIVRPGGGHGLPILWPWLLIDRECAVRVGRQAPHLKFRVWVGRARRSRASPGLQPGGSARGF